MALDVRSPSLSFIRLQCTRWVRMFSGTTTFHDGDFQ